MLKIAVILGSTRPNRNGKGVADWVVEQASQRTDAEFTLVDLHDMALPMLDEPLPAASGQYSHEHTRAWAQTIAGFDGFIFVTPEYNHSTSGVLKNALDFIYAEWNNKAAGFVSYGSVGGVRAVEHLRVIAAELQIATVRAQVALPLATEFVDYSIFAPTEGQSETLSGMLDQLVSWSTAMATLRR
ncbi:MAG: NAD(P)H-dependent oxidoreductase [Microbacteriaceae bacterium]|nr:NAD(P)H-dependent oxidoreductase [Microbacteriaceae bacterium]